MDWTQWHREYESSPSLRSRLAIVRTQIAVALDACDSEPITIVSICAGDGRDVIEALQLHPKAASVQALLVDTEGESLARGRAAAERAGLGGRLRFVQADATRAASYADAGHADLVLVSGMLGHLRHEDARRLIESLPMLCKPGGSVIWNRHVVLNDGERMVPVLRERLAQVGFAEQHVEATTPRGFVVGRARFAGPSVRLDPARVLFEFVGLDALEPAEREPPPPPPLFDVEQSLPARFAQVTAEHGARIALDAGAWRPSYDELNRRANRLAHALLARGGRPGDRVALLMRHDAPLVAGVLAVLKAGRTVVVLNPGDPPARLRQVLEDAEPALLVADAEHRAAAAECAPPACAVVGFDEPAVGPEHDPEVSIAPDDVAFLLYTSGSAGRPKGVMQTHRNVLHNAARLSRGMALAAEDRLLLLASLSGGQGVATTCCALMNGAALCPFPVMERGVVGLPAWMNEHRITVFVSSASVFRHFLRTIADAQRFPAVRLVRLASEPATALDFAAFRKHFAAQCVLFHTLSSSETGNVTQLRLRAADAVAEGRLSAGVPAEGMTVVLQDEQGRAVPVGAIGELTVHSRYLSPGYWRNEALTAQRFSSADPGGRGGQAGVRVYRSGDLARRTADGRLMFVGRKDAQVKLRGYRIDVSEVEAALAQQPSVERAVACERTTPGGDAQLVAYVLNRPGQTCSVESLRAALAATLPRYMVPNGFVVVDEFPLTPHGKVDRERLARIDPPVPALAPEQEPAPGTEQLLAGIWGDVLGRSRIGRHDSFLELGGDSLSATVVAARVHALLHVDLDLRAFSSHARLADLAGLIDGLIAAGPTRGAEGGDEGGDEGRPTLLRAPRDAPLPLSFAQERIWTYSRTSSADYVVACGHTLRGPLDAEVLRDCMSYLARRHEILRTTFSESEGRVVQSAHAAQPVELPLIDFTGRVRPERRAMELLHTESRRPFDLARGPLLRFWLVRIRPDEHWLLRVNHHIISDGWSWQVYLRELAALYEARLHGQMAPLPEFETLQYGDYAAWQRQALRPDGAAWNEELAWWRQQLAGQPAPLVLPFTRPEPLEPADPECGLLRWGLSRQVSRRLDRVAREHGATPNMIRLAGLAAFLTAQSGSPDVVLGSYVTERTRVEWQDMFGCFANLIALRLRGDASESFLQWIDTARTAVTETQAHAEIPYDVLGEALREQGLVPPEIRMIFGASDHAATLRFGGLELEWLERRFGSMPWGFSLIFDLSHEEHRCYAAFDVRLYHPAHVRRWIGRFKRFLAAASLRPQAPVGKLLAASRWVYQLPLRS